MKKEQLYEIIGDIDESYLSTAHTNVKKSTHHSWTIWISIAACLCLVAVGVFAVVYYFQNNNSAPSSPSGAGAEKVIYNNAQYFVCGKGEIEIIETCGLSVNITKDLAGEHLGYLEKDDNEAYILSTESSEYELFEYAPQPNDNIYIVCIEGKYYAAIRHDSQGYHGLYGYDVAKKEWRGIM